MARVDHVFYYRHGTVYSHHGIGTGDGTVIHYDSNLWRKLTGSANLDAAPEICEVTWHQFSGGKRPSCVPMQMDPRRKLS